jgi:hypothetical protein
LCTTTASHDTLDVLNLIFVPLVGLEEDFEGNSASCIVSSPGFFLHLKAKFASKLSMIA